jgi:hypothetical protein
MPAPACLARRALLQRGAALGLAGIVGTLAGGCSDCDDVLADPGFLPAS